MLLMLLLESSKTAARGLLLLWLLGEGSTAAAADTAAKGWGLPERSQACRGPWPRHIVLNGALKKAARARWPTCRRDSNQQGLKGLHRVPTGALFNARAGARRTPDMSSHQPSLGCGNELLERASAQS